MNYHLVAIYYHSSNYWNPKFVKKCPCRLATLESKYSTTLPASQPQLTRERSDDNLLHRGLNARRASLNAAARAASGLASALASALATTAKCNAMYRNSEWPFDTMKKVLTDSLYLSKKTSSDWRLWKLHSAVNFIYSDKATKIWRNLSVSQSYQDY